MLILKQNAANTVPTPPAGKGTIFLDDSDTLSVKTSDGNVENFPTVAASNSQVVFMNGTSLSGEAALTYDFNNNILNVTGNVAAGNVKTDNLLYANGTPWDLSDPGGSNTQIQFNDDESFGGSAALTFNKSSNLVSMGGALSVTGNANVGNLGTAQVLASANVTAPQLISNIATGTAPLVVSSTTRVANLDVAKAGVANTVNDAAQPNITSVGTLSSLAVTGNVTSGNVYANAGTIGASNLTGTLTTAAQPNITSVGTLTNLAVSGNAIISGNLTVDGNLVYVNVETLAVEDPIIQLQTGPNGAAPSSNSGKDVGSALNYYNSQARVAFMGWDVSNAEFGLASEASIANEVVTFSTYGNLRAGVYFGNAAGLVNIPGGNIVGNITGNISNAAHAVTANTVVDAAQPNITSVGTLTSLSVTGNASAGNISTGGVLNVTGNANVGNIGATQGVFTNVSGNGSALSSITGANVTGAVTYATTANAVAGANVSGQVANALVAGTVYTAAQPNITSVGTLSALNVSGNIAAPNITANTGAFYGNAAGLTNIPAGNITGQVANALVAGTVYTNAQPNITEVGTLSSLAVTGNGTFGNVYANSGTIGASLLTGTLTTAAQPNVTSVGTLSSLTVSGNAGANNFNATTHVTAGNVYANSGTVGASLLAGTLTTASQPNVTSVGTLSSLTVTGNVSAGNLSGTLLTGTLVTAAQPNVTSVGTLSSLTVSGNANVGNLGTAGLIVATGNVTGGNINTSGKVVASTLESNVATGTAPFTVASTTKVTNLNADLLDGFSTATAATANTVVIRDADGSFSANIITGTLSGAATTAGTVTTAAQPNITSVGTLTGLGVNGTITGVNITANTGVFTGNGSGLSQLAGGNVTGQVGNALVAGTVYTNAQPNITSVGTLTSLTVTGNANVGNLGTGGLIVATGNVTGGNLVTSGVLSVTGNANVGNLGTAGLIVATGNVTGGNLVTSGALSVTGNGNLGNVGAAAGVFTANVTAGNVYANTGTIGASLLTGTLTTAAQPNITSVGTLTSLAVTGNATAGNVYANSGTIGASLLTGTLTTAAQPNITSVGTLTSVSVTGNVAAGNLTTTGVLSVTGTGVSSIAGNLDMTSNTIINLATPTNPTDAATKQYVDDIAQGLHVHAPCYTATFNTLAVLTGGTITYNNGTAGVGANLVLSGSPTANFTAANTFDANTTAIVGSRILVKNEANTAHNGIYVVDSATVLTRATDFDTPTEMAGGDFTFVQNGDNYNDTGWVMTDPVTTVGTSPVTFVQFSGAGTYQAGTGLTLTGSVFSVNASQSQITSVGTLSFLGVNGNLTAANVFANTGAFYGNGSGLSDLVGGNVTGQVANALVAGTVYTAAQPNVTSLGTLTGLGVNGNITAVNITANTGVFTGNGSALSVLNASNISSGTLAQARLANASVTLGSTALTLGSTVTTVAGLTSVTSTTFVGALTGAATTAGTVTTAAQPNITSLGTLTGLGVNGTVTAVNITANTGVFTGNANGISSVQAANIVGTTLSSTVVTSSLTTVGTLGSLNVSGNITAPNLIANTGFVISSVNAAVSAAGTAQGNATALTREINVTSTVASGAGVALPTAVAGMRVTIINTAANAVLVYPASGGQINSLGTNASFSQGAGAKLDFVATSTTQWYTLNATYL